LASYPVVTPRNNFVSADSNILCSPPALKIIQNEWLKSDDEWLKSRLESRYVGVRNTSLKKDLKRIPDKIRRF
jgi:hypothetical protein